MKELIEAIKIPVIKDDAILCFVEGNSHIPFAIRRSYFILKPEPNLPRGFHAHRRTNQVLFCLQGSVKITVDNGRRREEAILIDQPEVGILLPPMLWHEMHGMDLSTILLVLADQKYDPSDYIRNYEEFLALANKLCEDEV